MLKSIWFTNLRESREKRSVGWNDRILLHRQSNFRQPAALIIGMEIIIMYAVGYFSCPLAYNYQLLLEYHQF